MTRDIEAAGRSVAGDPVAGPTPIAELESRVKRRRARRAGAAGMVALVLVVGLVAAVAANQTSGGKQGVVVESGIEAGADAVAGCTPVGPPPLLGEDTSLGGWSVRDPGGGAFVLGAHRVWNKDAEPRIETFVVYAGDLPVDPDTPIANDTPLTTPPAAGVDEPAIGAIEPDPADDATGAREPGTDPSNADGTLGVSGDQGSGDSSSANEQPADSDVVIDPAFGAPTGTGTAGVDPATVTSLPADAPVSSVDPNPPAIGEPGVGGTPAPPARYDEMVAQARACVEKPPVLPVDQWPAKGVLVRAPANSDVTLVLDEHGQPLGRVEDSLVEFDHGTLGAIKVTPGADEPLQKVDPGELAASSLAPPPMEGMKFENFVLPSPDKEWSLVEGKNDCGRSTAYFLIEAGQLEPVVNEPEGSQWLHSTHVRGWWPDHTAIIEIDGDPCENVKMPFSGVYAVEPGGQQRLLHPQIDDSLVSVAFVRTDTGPTVTTVAPPTTTTPNTDVPTTDEPTTTPPGGADAEQMSAWQDALVRWDNYRAPYGDHYSFDYQHSCFCAEEATNPARLTVDDSKVVAAEPKDPSRPVMTDLSRYQRIDELFAFIQTNLADPNLVVEVSYDATTGAPTSVAIKCGAKPGQPQIADCDQSFTISNIEFG